MSSEGFEVKLRMLVVAKRETQRALESALKQQREQEAQAARVQQEIDNVFANEVEGEERRSI